MRSTGGVFHRSFQNILLHNGIKCQRGDLMQHGLMVHMYRRAMNLVNAPEFKTWGEKFKLASKKAVTSSLKDKMSSCSNTAALRCTGDAEVKRHSYVLEGFHFPGTEYQTICFKTHVQAVLRLLSG
jgi:hypothetical protein